MSEIDEEIARLEAKAQQARKAINRACRKRDKLLALAHKADLKAARTRNQHLEPANRIIADLMMIKSKIEQL